MKCTLLSENFKKALSLTERNIGRDVTLPIISSILISTEKNSLKLMSTNLEIGIETSVRGTIQDAGKVAIPAKTISSFISTLPKEEKIILSSINGDLYIETDSQKTLFKGYQPEDFPPFPTIKDPYHIQLKKIDLAPILTKSLVSISKSAIKPELSSTLFSLEKNILTIVTTDSFRLSEEKIKSISTSSKNQQESFLLPLRTCEEILRLMDYGAEENIDFFIGRGEILVRYGDTRIYSRLTEGTFPEYSQIIPRKFETKVLISKKLLSSHIKRASLFTNKLNGVLIGIHPEKNECSIESNNRDVGEYKAVFPADITGGQLSVVFNYQYLLDGVESFPDEQLFLGFNTEAHPLLIHPAKKEQSLYVVMPMKGGV